MLHSAEFLASTPSQIAATAIIATANCTNHYLVQQEELTVFAMDVKSPQFYLAALEQISLNSQLKIWSEAMEETTKMDLGKQVRPTYEKFLALLRESK